MVLKIQEISIGMAAAPEEIAEEPIIGTQNRFPRFSLAELLE